MSRHTIETNHHERVGKSHLFANQKRSKRFCSVSFDYLRLQQVGFKSLLELFNLFDLISNELNNFYCFAEFKLL